MNTKARTRRRAKAQSAPPDFEVIVIGAGMGGIAAGIKLQEIGVTDFLIVDRDEAFGGTWLRNTYPGVAADLPMVAYQFSFAPKADWKRFFASGEEIQNYHVGLALEAGLQNKARFNTEIAREVWREDLHCWELHVATGEIITARFVISAIGAYINPKDKPDIPGLESFSGEVMVPAHWNHDYDFEGKRVAVIGVGSSSVQIVPSVAPMAEQLDVYQRTVQWYFPKPDFPLPRILQAALQIPGSGAAVHGVALAFIELGLRLLIYTPDRPFRAGARVFDRVVLWLYRAWLRLKVDDPETRRKLRPPYGPGCTRGTLGGDYLPTFNRDNVDLITSPISHITEDAIVNTDGTTRTIDCLVLATGYEMFSDPESYREGAVVGRDGFDLGRFYNSEGLQAYQSASVPGLPNRWMIVGPYSWTGTAFHYIVETALRHITRALSETRRRGATKTEVRQEALDRFQSSLQRCGRNLNHYFSLHCAGSNTYFVNSHGDSPYVRPWTLLQSRRRSVDYPLDDYTYERFDQVSSALGSVG